MDKLPLSDQIKLFTNHLFILTNSIICNEHRLLFIDRVTHHERLDQLVQYRNILQFSE